MSMPVSNQPQQPKTKTVAQKRIEITKGMSVDEVKQKGSDGQKLMAPLFDLNSDGVFSKREAKDFNSYNFTCKKNEITMYKNLGDGKREVTEIKYNDFEEDVLCMYKGKPLNAPEFFSFYNEKDERSFFGKFLGTTADTVKIDMINKTVYVKGAKGPWIGAIGVKMDVVDSNVQRINFSNGEIHLKNTKGLIPFTDPTIISKCNAKVTTDGVSKYNFKQD